MTIEAITWYLGPGTGYYFCQLAKSTFGRSAEEQFYLP